MKIWGKVFLLVCLMITLEACTRQVESPSNSNVDGTVESPIGAIEPSATYANSLPELTKTPESVLPQEATIVPSGILVLVDYPPLIMNYDSALWVDKSEYSNAYERVNYLQAVSLSSCILGPSGPSGFFPQSDTIVELNDIRYSVIKESLEPGKIITYYFALSGVKNYSTENSVTVLNVIATEAEAKECIQLAEAVLSTLHAP